MKALKEPRQIETKTFISENSPSKLLKKGDAITYKVWHENSFKTAKITLIRHNGEYVDSIPAEELTKQTSLRGDYAIYCEGIKGDYIFYNQIIEICTE